MVTKILNYFNISMPNITYKSSGQAQEFSQRTLTNMGYFWDVNYRVYYFRTCKNDRKIYNFDDPAEFGDDDAKGHMDDEKPIGPSHGVHKGDVVMQDAPHVYAHGSNFGTCFTDTSSIMTMLQNMQFRQDKRYMEDCQRQAFKATQMK